MDLSRPFQDLLGNNTAQILRRLAMVSGELSGRRIAYLAGVPPVSAARVLAALTEIGLVHSRYIGQSKAFQLNREHVLWPPLQAIMTSAQAVERGITDLAAELAPRGTTVAIFGSFARGEAGPASDVDIVMVSKVHAHPDERFGLSEALNERISSMTGNTVDLIDINDDDLGGLVRADDALVGSWIEDARTLHGLDLRARIQTMRVPE